MKQIHRTIIAFVVSALAGLALRSHDLFVVDGAVRCLTVFKSPTIHFHPNNHLLYLVDVFNWTRLVGALGFKLSDPLSFVLAVDTMNGLAAAGCVAILFWIILRVTGSWTLTASVCVAYGLTTAFLQQATNANEPIVGAFWSFLAIMFAIVSLGNQRIWPLLVSGLLFALAMATYRSMVFVMPTAAILLISPIDQSKSSRKFHFLRLTAIAIALVS